MKSSAKKISLTQATSENRSSPHIKKKTADSMAWLPPLSVVILTFLVFIPTVQNQFVNWDDLVNVVDNPNYRGLGWTHLRWMFTTFHLSLYRPITWMTLGVDYLLWGMNASGYHFTSLLFHCANSLLFYFIALRLLRLSLPSPGNSSTTLRFAAAFAALVFALHPLRVEAVAWVSARNDLVSAFFLFGSTLGYLNAAAAEKSARYLGWISVAFFLFVLSLLAKGMGMTFPVVLLLLDVYPLKRLPGNPKSCLAPETQRIALEKLPFLLAAIAAGILALRAKQAGQVVHAFQEHGIGVRIAETFYGLAFYLWKTILPFSLSPLYQRPDTPDPSHWIFWLSAFAVLAITISLLILRHRWPAGMASWIYYGVTLAPVLGVVQFGHQMVADRYSYLACLGWAIVAGAAVGYFGRSIPGSAAGKTNFIGALAALLLLALSFLTWQQTRVWHDSERLWKQALSVDPNSSYAYNNLATEMKAQGQIDDAIRYFHRAVVLSPRFPLGYHNLGDALAERGNLDDAVQNYRKALELDPTSIRTYRNLGAALARQRRFDEAISQFSKVLEQDPKNAAAHNDLGNTLLAEGNWEQAMAHYRKAAESDPWAAEPYLNIANVLVRLDRVTEAVTYFDYALKLEPNDPQAHHNLGRVLASQGKLDDAVHHFRMAVRLQPSFMTARRSLVLALQQQGKTAEASREYAEAMRFLNPGSPSTDR